VWRLECLESSYGLCLLSTDNVTVDVSGSSHSEDLVRLASLAEVTSDTHKPCSLSSSQFLSAILHLLEHLSGIHSELQRINESSLLLKTVSQCVSVHLSLSVRVCLCLSTSVHFFPCSFQFLPMKIIGLLESRNYNPFLALPWNNI